ncbi:MAG: DUF1178 family protein [Nisaea sp.]|nr:DUF1178 family protein [Nisaea sp.]
MILYQLQCDAEHQFEAWFKDSQAYEKQAKRKLLTCPVCGSTKVSKALMSPRISKSKNVSPSTPLDTVPSRGLNVTHQNKELRKKLQELRTEIEQNCDYVGDQFAEEARKIHYGEADAKNIYGEASFEDAKELVDEGVDFTPIPWLPKENS